MAFYLLEVAYTPEAWSALVKNPQDRSQAIKDPVEKLGGRVERFWMAFGEYDVVGVIEMPDSVSAAAFAMAVSAGGACKSVKTIPLLTAEQGQEALKKAATCGYTPVSATRTAGR